MAWILDKFKKNKLQVEKVCISREINRYNRFGYGFAVLALKISDSVSFGLNQLLPGKTISFHIIEKKRRRILRKNLRSYDRLIKSIHRKYYIILPNTDETKVEPVIQRINKIARIYNWGDVSVSVAVCPRDGEDPQALLNKLS